MNWRQRRGAEELLDRCGHGTDIDKALGSDDVQILQGHALADNALHAAEADAELVLEQLAHAADAAVAEVVDIVRFADAMAEAVKVIDGGKDIVVDDVLGDKHVDILTDSVLESVALELLAELLHNDAANLFLDAELCRVKVHIAGNVHHAVGENAHGLAVDIEENVDNTGSRKFRVPCRG